MKEHKPDKHFKYYFIKRYGIYMVARMNFYNTQGISLKILSGGDRLFTINNSMWLENYNLGEQVISVHKKFEEAMEHYSLEIL